jgi:preprotein translocase subunit SecA
MLKFLNSLFDTNKKEVESLRNFVSFVNDNESRFKKLKDSELKAQIAKLKKQLQEGKTTDDIMPEVFALTREAGVRVLKQRAYDVQLMAGIAFHQGKIAEQKTGEGKTLSAVPALVLNAMVGQGAHLVTVNDYLARIGVGWMGPIYHLLGLSVSVIYSGKGDLPSALYDPEYTDPSHDDERLRHLRPISRREAYQADITYGTNNEFGFDYLRDNMAHTLTQMNQRGHFYAIVDEVDSILIDEARTPLIISAPDSEATEKYFQFAQIVNSLVKKTDYEIDEKMGTANLTDYGLKKIEKMLNVDNLYEKDFSTVHHLEQALKAHSLFEKDKQYIIKDGQIIIVDEHTGRLMYGRRYSDGLHQAIEAKENVPIQQESRTLATISLQNYFRLYQKLAGMTGTAATEADEFRKIYGLEVIVIPTNRQVQRTDHSDVVYKTQTAKYRAIVAEVEDCYHRGQPVLIGTKSIEQNDVVSRFLKHKKIPHQILNAKNHESEAGIISQAGRLKAVTVATNIAGRGVDIVLGGTQEGRNEKDWQKEHDAVIAAGGLHVLGVVRHESRRIDNQLRGRSGRQGDPGSSSFYISLEDDIMRIFGGDQISRLMDILKVPEDQPLEAGMVSKAIETAQSKVESFHFDQRKHVVEYDDVMNKQREIFYARRYKLLELSDDESGISEKIDETLKSEATILATIYSPDGISTEESNRIIKEFQEILPLDSHSSHDLEKKLIGTDQTAMTEILTAVISQGRDAQKKHFGPILKQIETQVALTTYDELWMEHLDAVDDLRDGIGLRGYAQKDPLVEYKAEAFTLFESLLDRINYQIARRIFRVQLIRTPPPPVTQEIHETSSETIPSTTKDKNPEAKSIGRNDPCPCGSGKKYKKCCYPKYG